MGRPILIGCTNKAIIIIIITNIITIIVIIIIIIIIIIILLFSSATWTSSFQTQKAKYILGALEFKCVKGLAPSYLCHRFKTRACVHDRNTRYKNNLNIPAYKSASGQRTFLYPAMSFWNSLPREIRECDNLQILKRH